jgi:predicted anti-sigma-YlaC factor YlaD
MSRFGRNVECEHARVWAALAPDGELSELEQRSLRSHLRGCAPCTSFAREVQGVTSLLRSEELVSPSSIAASTRLMPRRQSGLARVRPIAAAAAVALMALGVASRAPLPVDERNSTLRTSTRVVTAEQLEMQSLHGRSLDALLAADQSQLERLPTMGSNEPV